MREGWLIDANDHWFLRFRDNTAWLRDPKGFIDRGRQMPEGLLLLKESVSAEGRCRADVKSLQTQGWKKTRPLWGATVEP